MNSIINILKLIFKSNKALPKNVCHINWLIVYLCVHLTATWRVNRNLYEPALSRLLRFAGVSRYPAAAQPAAKNVDGTISFFPHSMIRYDSFHFHRCLIYGAYFSSSRDSHTNECAHSE